MAKIAVVGAGAFGCMAAIRLSQAGHKVYLFEREKFILSCASGINQYRLHRGYHYPRSKETVEYVKESSILFEEEFPSTICRNFDRYYAISKEGSMISPAEYLDFLSNNDLEFEIAKKLRIVREDKISLLVKVVEHGFDPTKLYLSMSQGISSSGVRLRTNRTFLPDEVEDYDVVVNATYSDLNGVIDNKVQYQYELCEKPIVQLPTAFKGKSVVILDGEFCCVDPIGFNADYQVLGHVREAIHDRKVGSRYYVPGGYQDILNKGRVVSNLSRFGSIWRGFKEYFNVGDVNHIGSMYTVRTVLPNREHDDARPSEIIKHSDSMYSLFSGKIGTCVDIANKLVKQI